MIVLVLVAGLALFAVLASRFGADSRETERIGWIVERPRPLAARERAKALRARTEAPPEQHCSRPAVQTM
jgi:hypothetical protein